MFPAEGFQASNTRLLTRLGHSNHCNFPILPYLLPCFSSICLPHKC